MRQLRTILLIICAIVFVPIATRAQSIVTVTGNFQSATGSTVAGSAGTNFLRIRLRNFAGNLPRTNSSVLVQIDNDVIPDSSTGVISTTVYGNDDITPAGTFYSFDFYVGGRLRVSANFAICRAVSTGGCSGFSSSFNFNVAAPLSTIPVVVPGDGDSTYLRLDGGNVYSAVELPIAALSLGEISAPSGAVGKSKIWADATAHRLKVKDNNGAADTFAKFTDKLNVFASTTSAELLGIISDETAGGGVLVTTGAKLNVFAATTSAELAGVLSDETGSGGGFVRATGATISATTVTSGLTNNTVVIDGIIYPATQTGLSNAITAAQSTGTCVVIPPNTTITLSSAVTWNSTKACLLGSGPTSVIATSGSSSYTGLAFNGTLIGASSNLASSAAEGTGSVTLVGGGVAALSLSVGDYVLISDAQATPSKEVTRVTAIAGEVITTADIMYEGFTTGNTAKVQKLAVLDSVRVGNFKLDLTGNSGSSSFGMQVSNLVNSDIFDITVVGAKTGGMGIQADTGYRNSFRNLRFNKVGTSSSYADFNVWAHTDSSFRDIFSSESGCFGPEFAWVNGSQFINFTVAYANYRGFKMTRSSWNNLSNLNVTYASVASAGTYTGIHLETGSRRNNLSNFVANFDGLDGLAFDPTSINNTAVNGTVAYNTTDVLFDTSTTYNSVINTSYATLADNSGNSTNTISQPGTLPRSISCGNTSTCGNVDLTKTRIVSGLIGLSMGTVTITGITGFTSTGTYFCNATDTSALNPVRVQLASASSITITGTGSDNISYTCTGN